MIRDVRCRNDLYQGIANHTLYTTETICSNQIGFEKESRGVAMILHDILGCQIGSSTTKFDGSIFKES